VLEGYEGLQLGLDVLGPYLAHVHIGGHAPRPDERGADGTMAWSWQSTDLQDGLLSTTRLLDELRRIGYGGFITVEDLRPDLDAGEKSGRAITYLRGLGDGH
jgi:sugar phosphate isomerase/epimerase